MAIDNGIAVDCSALQSTGGIKTICLRSFASGDAVTFNNDAAKHDVTKIVDSGGTSATWKVFEFKNETAELTVNATKENGSTVFECGLNFMIPQINNTKMHELQTMLNTCMMAIVVTTNDEKLVVGLSEKYANSVTSPEKNQTFLNLASMEGGTGAAYADQNGLTISLMARQFELPRQYDPASGAGLAINTSTLTATTT
tara:strand:- start:1364 stop:1960 length:597 start_codon:yes stop_codon:yes gene_type:complete